MAVGLELRDLLADIIVGKGFAGDQALGCQQWAQSFLHAAGHADDYLIPA
jgi:hypothetical protein